MKERLDTGGLICKRDRVKGQGTDPCPFMMTVKEIEAPMCKVTVPWVSQHLTPCDLVNKSVRRWDIFELEDRRGRNAYNS